MYVLLGERSSSDAATTFDYDNAIYVYDSTCHDDVGLTMTLAHEFQHFIQYGFHRPTWAANTLALNLSKQTFQALGFTWANIATEREARLVSMRVAERLFGRERVRVYIELRKTQPANPADAADWEFVETINTDSDFDLEVETRQMYQRIAAYRQELTDLWRDVAADPDFESLDPRELFSAAFATAAV